MTRTPLDLKPLPRPHPQKYEQCAVQGCGGHPRSFSRFCTNHARNFHRTRDPNGRAVRSGELRDHLRLAEEYLQRNASHPAVVAAEEFLKSNLGDTRLPGAIRKEMRRLTQDGAEPRAMLINYLAVEGLSFWLPHTHTSDACHDFNIGNRVLRTTSLPSYHNASGKRRPTRIPPRVAEAYGMILRKTLGVFARQFWRRVQSEIDAAGKAASAVADAVRDTPFDAPPAAAEEVS